MKPYIAAIICLVLVLTCQAQAGPSQLEQQLFDLVNREREKAGLNKLVWNDRLAAAALEHSRLLAKNLDLSHQFDGEAPLQQRVGATGLRFNSVAENVAAAPTVDVTHKGLMESPGHRANILHQDYNAIGISIVDRNGELFVTQDFAHTLVSYSEKQFQDAVVAGFKQARHARGLPSVDVMIDPRLRKSACAQDMNTDKMIQGLPGAASLLVFSLTEPGLPGDMRRLASDRSVERMSIGVCLQTGGKTGFSKFWVVAAFYRSQTSSIEPPRRRTLPS
jgi:cysteine-rich secretory family protein